jgi:bifunctional UDP-N-acetylglucosamine pyrophosphorylase/glucosamine-1-phosphate N-acetyltransferase
MPVLLTNPLETFPIGNLPLNEHLADLPIHRHPHAWVSRIDALALMYSGKSTMIDSKGATLAWLGIAPDPDSAHEAGSSLMLVHSWDLLAANEDYLSRFSESNICGEVHESAVLDGCVHLGAGSRILPGVVIEGNVIIGEHCKIGPNCYIRGSTSIGDHCHIGHAVEIKNSIILSNSSIGHLSYVGDSVIGRGVNFGAGTITSNLRHDGNNHRTPVAGQLVDTGRRKFGTIVGDGVHTGINTSIYPGRKFAPGSTTLPGEVVNKDKSR